MPSSDSAHLHTRAAAPQLPSCRRLPTATALSAPRSFTIEILFLRCTAMFDLQWHGRRVPMCRTAWARRQQRTAHCSIMQSRARQGKHTTHWGNAALVPHTTISDSPAVETRHEVRSVTYTDDGKALRATRATLYDIMQHSGTTAVGSGTFSALMPASRDADESASRIIFSSFPIAPSAASAACAQHTTSNVERCVRDGTSRCGDAKGTHERDRTDE